MSKPVLIFRWIVFLLALFYFVDRFRVETYDMAHFGWQFRYLTIWGLTGSLVSAMLMLQPAFNRRNEAAATFLSTVAIINALVVFSYWRLYFTDPALVNGDNPPVLYREYYLHLVGPLLQWFDLLFIKRGFRFPTRTTAALLVMVLIYVEWIEFVVRPLNSEPVGTVTSGLPYPFLNDMELASRCIFYLSIFLTGLVFILLFRVVQIIIVRLGSRRRAQAT